jgi:putative ATP-dependent endonuclease of the OLD family
MVREFNQGLALQTFLAILANRDGHEMKVARLHIQGFRGIKEAALYFPDHVVLVGDNNVGKSSVFEALDLTLGPDRLGRRPKIDEHDFFRGEYISAEGEPRKEVKIEVTVTGLTEEQQNRFVDCVEWWDTGTKSLLVAPPAEGTESPTVHAALRVSFIGFYDPEEDDFDGETYFTRTMVENEVPTPFRKKDKQFCGFLYLRSVRTGSRALSLEHGSLLDIILRLKEIRPQMWEKTIEQLSGFDVASDPALGISGVLESIEKAINKYVPREWGATPRLKVSSLTRESLRKIVTAFIATGEGDHAAPFYRQGTGTLNMLVLAMLTQIAEDKQNVIFAMEEPETAIPPYAQKRIVHEICKLSSQALFTSHSPYVLEEFDLHEVVVLVRSPDGIMNQAAVELPSSVKPKRYRHEFRTRFCEGLLSRRVLLAEGATEASAMPAVARHLSEINGQEYSSFEALGICTIDAGTDSQIAELGKLYSALGKTVFAVCDKQTPISQQAIEAQVHTLFMHDQSDFEKVVLKNTTPTAMQRFIASVQLPPHLTQKYPDPSAGAAEVLSDYFNWSKGDWGIAEFLEQCDESEVPEWIRATCHALRNLCQPPKADSGDSDPSPGDPPADNSDLV